MVHQHGALAPPEAKWPRLPRSVARARAPTTGSRLGRLCQPEAPILPFEVPHNDAPLSLRPRAGPTVFKKTVALRAVATVMVTVPSPQVIEIQSSPPLPNHAESPLPVGHAAVTALLLQPVEITPSQLSRVIMFAASQEKGPRMSQEDLEDSRRTLFKDHVPVCGSVAQ
jgi:hypothetical protein